MSDSDSTQLRHPEVGDKSEPKPTLPPSGPAPAPVASSAPLGLKHNLQKILCPAVIGLNVFAIIFSLIVFTDRELSEGSYSYYIALFLFALVHTIFLANSFLEDSSTTNLPQRLLKNENFQLLAFAAIFWFSSPYMWVVFPVLIAYAAFQIFEVIPQLGSLNLPIPPAVTAILDNLKPKKPLVLNYVAILEPVLLAYTVLIFYWNHVFSIVPYFLWVCARYEYSPYTKFALDFLNGHIEKALAGQDKIKPHYATAKQYLGAVGRALPH